MKSPLILLPLFLSILSTNANPIPAPTPPNIPSGSTARSQLAALRVAPVGTQSGYSRDLFPHWITQSGACNTREVVLKRDGTNVVQDSSCAAVSGQWYSPYDGAVWTLASDVDIDHLVPLSNAWKVCQPKGVFPLVSASRMSKADGCPQQCSREPHPGRPPVANNSPTTSPSPSSSP